MIKLVRLDYRLLHGQVVFSWTGHVGAQRIIVVDDDAANDEMKKSALLLSKPAGVRVNIFTVDKAIAKMPKVEQLDEKIMMIFGNTAALLKFCQACHQGLISHHRRLQRGTSAFRQPPQNNVLLLL